MAKRKSDFEAQIDADVEGWVAVRKSANQAEWHAWTNWRRENANTRLEPDNLTVPTMFPPTTVAAANNYLDVVKRIRKLVNWSDKYSHVSSDPKAWMG